jgi:Zn-finger nucleic acid-binding protein
MKCPIDNTELAMTERQGIEIDYCPKCRGVWLDRGELDKIIERSAQQEASQPAEQTRYREEPRHGDESKHREQPAYKDDRGYRPHKKRKSLLGEIFDFD